MTTNTTPHAAESMHWYARDGAPAYEVQGKTGLRPATLRDARKLGLVPSVTTIIRCASAPALEMWKAKQVMLAAMTLPRHPGESDESFCERVMRDSKEEGRKAANRGTDIHAAIQGHYEGKVPDMAYWEHVQGTVAAVAAYCEQVTWTAERSFAHPLGFGGKCDLSCDRWVLDFKTKECKPEDELKTWDEHAMQLAAYRQGLGVGARCAIVYVSAIVPGYAKVIEIPEDELRRGWGMFRGLLDYWKSKSSYYPELWEAKEAA